MLADRPAGVSDGRADNRADADPSSPTLWRPVPVAADGGMVAWIDGERVALADVRDPLHPVRRTPLHMQGIPLAVALADDGRTIGGRPDGALAVLTVDPQALFWLERFDGWTMAPRPPVPVGRAYRHLTSWRGGWFASGDAAAPGLAWLPGIDGAAPVRPTFGASGAIDTLPAAIGLDERLLACDARGLQALSTSRGLQAYGQAVPLPQSQRQAAWPQLTLPCDTLGVGGDVLVSRGDAGLFAIPHGGPPRAARAVAGTRWWPLFLPLLQSDRGTAIDGAGAASEPVAVAHRGAHALLLVDGTAATRRWADAHGGLGILDDAVEGWANGAAARDVPSATLARWDDWAERLALVAPSDRSTIDAAGTTLAAALMARTGNARSADAALALAEHVWGRELGPPPWTEGTAFAVLVASGDVTDAGGGVVRARALASKGAHVDVVGLGSPEASGSAGSAGWGGLSDVARVFGVEVVFVHSGEGLAGAVAR
ncbi:MAG: hypothetical protein U0470_11550 [Anaerolineae bacterium]